MSEYILEMQDVIKEYSGVRVLKNINFKVRTGEILGLCGENGAGKSTMMNIISGVIPKGEYEGTLLVDGKDASFSRIAESEAAGISIIHQELALAPELDVCENIFLGNMPGKHGFIDWDQAYYDTEKLLKRLSLSEQGITAKEKIAYLSTGQQQLVEIAKAISRDVRLLLLDEPTSALTEREIDILMDIMRRLKQEDVTCVYISHKLEEVMALADSICVLRDGEVITQVPKEDISEDGIIAAMVGREITNRFPKKEHNIGETVFELKHYSVEEPTTGKEIVKDISFDVRSGEVLGIAGLMGSGRSELMTSIFGCWDGKHSGEVFLNGEKLTIKSPKDAIAKGIGMVTEDRKLTGLLLDQSIRMNTTIANLKSVSNHNVLDHTKEVVGTLEYMKKLQVKAASMEQHVEHLSGGNQQKVVIAKWLMANPKVLILDEPTRGVDVGAKIEIYNIMNDLLEKGVSIIMISSELPEVLGMSDRIVIMHEGAMKGFLDAKEATQESVMAQALK